MKNIKETYMAKDAWKHIHPSNMQSIVSEMYEEIELLVNENKRLMDAYNKNIQEYDRLRISTLTFINAAYEKLIKY